MNIAKPKLLLRDFKKKLWDLHETDIRKYELSRGSIARAHVSRYGIHTKNGVYYYFNLRKTVELVICFHCNKNVSKDEAFYIQEYDTYLCPKHYLDLLEGKPIRLSNWRRRGV